MQKIRILYERVQYVEGPVAIVDIFERLQDGILKDVQTNKSDLVNAAVGQVFRKSEKSVGFKHHFSSSHQVFNPKMCAYP